LIVVLTIAMSVGTRRMVQRNVIVSELTPNKLVLQLKF
jgi:magnesium-transporting ATPase (P-type)